MAATSGLWAATLAASVFASLQLAAVARSGRVRVRGRGGVSSAGGRAPDIDLIHGQDPTRVGGEIKKDVVVGGRSGSVGLQNVLLIVVDDLRPQTKSYGVDFMATPHIDKLAAEGVLFEQAYVQQPICSPSRNSFLSGRYPAKTGVWNFINSFREGDGVQWTALPEFFRLEGYYTTGAGKLYHPSHPPNYDQNRSWSGGVWGGDYGQCACGGSGWPPDGQASCQGMDPSSLTCGDDEVVSKVVGFMEMAANGTLGNGTQPFFIGAGLHKPHLPFYAPQHMYDMYPEPEPPANPAVPSGSPYVAWHSCLSNAPGGNNTNWGGFTDIPNNMTYEIPMQASTAARLRRGYYASVSYTDANVGTILAALDATGAASSTVVLFIGDHGWSLGEGNEWCKMTIWETGVRVPLIIRAPGQQQRQGMRLRQLAEAVDLYKTLAELAGLDLASVEASVDGVSLAPAIRDAAVALPRQFARSVFPRCYTALNTTSTEKLPTLDRTDCQDIPRELFDFMGYSIRTDDFRLTEWRVWDGARLVARWDIPPNATELYDHRQVDIAKSPFDSEVENVAGNPAYAQTLRELKNLLYSAYGPSSEAD